MTKIHTTIGVYLNGSFKLNGVTPENLGTHIEHNIKYRPGRALFVDGECVHKGYLCDEKVKSFEERISKSLKHFTMINDTQPYQ